MSLSNDNATRNTGRVIMGLGSQGPMETSLSELQGQRDLTKWTSKTEEEYMTRVRDRATGAAKQIISQAMTKAAELREQGKAEGLQDATNQAQAYLDELAEQHALTLAQAMAALEQGANQLWNEHRQDIVTLVSMVVRKVINLEMDSRREEILASVMDQALEAIDSQRELRIKVNPVDEEAVTGLMERAKALHPGLERWSVRPDDNLQPGGMVLESAQGMVDNSMEGRWQIVEAVLDQLGLDNGSAAAPSEEGAGL
ncbi:FliH/SctL family protein [Desulfovibrio ferrophilus]|uniref:Flagellar assembly protein FliH n=1 Tax=Desulfovibrio ferrophilus TaxID=241368 RepID=A0A2Z6B1L4_9BACT|nr:FliH/SctL family protein [Desulfovibrio ferrophilus]BBD09348.1 H+ transporting two-sector ATPase E subunit [Desulfovibrio ferrophilus]